MGHFAHQQMNNTYLPIELPYSKSISNRALICQYLSPSPKTILHLSNAEDTLYLQKMLDELSVGKKVFYAHEGGTSLRFMMALLAAKGGRYTLKAAPALLKRPHKELIEMLKSLGAEINETDNSFIISGSGLSGGIISPKMDISSQYVSALLLVVPLMKNSLELILPKHRVSYSYVLMTVKLMQEFGAVIKETEKGLIVENMAYIPPETYSVERDWSSAAFIFAAIALKKKLKLALNGMFLSSVQADMAVLELFKNFGVQYKIENGVLRIMKGNSKQTSFSCNVQQYPDLMPALLITCAGLGIEANISALYHLQFKESNRIQLMLNNLQMLGFECSFNDDSVHLSGKRTKLSTTSVEINHGNDHRIVMAFAVLSLSISEIKISDMTCVNKSYPTFIEDLNKIKSYLKRA